MFFEEIKVDVGELQKLLESDAQGLMKHHQLFIERRFYVGDVGVNRKTLKDWETGGLLPYTYEGDGWRKFSFIEWAWLECINEFRQLGVSIEKIKDVKKILFEIDVDDFFSFLKEHIENYEGEIDQKETVIAAHNHPDLTPEIKKQALAELQLSPFYLILYTVVITDRNYCLVYNNSNYCGLISLGVNDDQIRKANEDTFINLGHDSFALVNIRKVVNRLFQKDETRLKNDFIIDFLLPREKMIFDHIRKSNAKEIIIKFNNNNEPTHIRVNRNQISKEILSKVARYLKNGSYQTIQFTTRNGELIKYDEEDIIKLE